MGEKRKLLAIALIFFGVLMLLSNYVPLFQMRFIWPIILIVIGLGMMFDDLYR